MVACAGRRIHRLLEPAGNLVDGGVGGPRTDDVGVSRSRIAGRGVSAGVCCLLAHRDADDCSHGSGGSLRHDRRGCGALGPPSGPARAWGVAVRHCGVRPGDRSARGAAFCADAAGLGVRGIGRLVLPAFPRLGGRGCVRLAGSSGPRGRRPAREAGHRVRFPQRDRSPFDDRLPVPNAALHPHLWVGDLLRCAFAGRRRVRPDCARRVGADRPGLRHCRGFGIVARSR